MVGGCPGDEGIARVSSRAAGRGKELHRRTEHGTRFFFILLLSGVGFSFLLFFQLVTVEGVGVAGEGEYNTEERGGSKKPNESEVDDHYGTMANNACLSSGSSKSTTHGACGAWTWERGGRCTLSFLGASWGT